jgi:Protein of unknown function (DUF4240)
MDLQYHVSVDNLTNNFLDNIKEQYPHAELEINVKTPKPFEGLTEKAFWDIIACFDWSDSEDDAAVIEQAVKILSEKPFRHIYEFQDILSAKLHALDTRNHAAQTGENAFLDKDSDFSVDEFLYARCCVVANGSDFYKKVLQQPSSMPKDLTFESLLTVAHQAYFRKTGKQFRYVPAYNIETFSNKKGWIS